MVYFIFGKMLILLCRFCDIIGLIFIVANCNILKNKITIWSHCLYGCLPPEDSVVSAHAINNIFSCLVVFNPIELETSHTVILPPMVSVSSLGYALIQSITWHSDQCDQIGRFFKFLVTRFLTKVVKMFGGLLGYFERHRFLSKTAVDTYWATFGKKWATLNSNIWSH